MRQDTRLGSDLALAGRPLAAEQMPIPSRRTSYVPLLFFVSLLAVASLAACSGDVPLSSSEASPSAPPVPVDASIASVALSDVVFDLFDGSYVPFPDADAALVEQMRDAIVPIYEPIYGGPEDGDWLPDRELIIGYVGENEAYAYPVRVLNFHELVTDTIDGIPLLITY